MPRSRSRSTHRRSSGSNSAESEADVSMSHRTPRRQQPEPTVALQSPMPGVVILNDEDWGNWRMQELDRVRWEEEHPLPTRSELPEKSDNSFIPDRDVYYERSKKAREELKKGLDAINAGSFNSGKDKDITIEINGRLLSPQSCRAFKDIISKKLKERRVQGIRKKIFEEDEDSLDDDFEREWRERRAAYKAKAKKLRRFNEQTGRIASPVDEFLDYIEETDQEDKADSKLYRKWLKERIKECDEGKISDMYPKYCQELRKQNKKKKRAESRDPRTFKRMVRKVQTAYNSLRRSSREAVDRIRSRSRDAFSDTSERKKELDILTKPLRTTNQNQE
ncbi:unnamed protein product [Caenorhabditis bovis]|uniref:Uncharacterized protein n=1 Tax=Caenorhabditis bovis TaxID=2654633 RepID=A0A8S1F3K3_9PELO|nr:unnamed protein product [Caenorhabditis bovis]